MTSSKFMPAEWQTDSRRHAGAQPPRFVRTHWDERSARAFGPWRVADASEPTDSLTRPSPVLPAPHPSATHHPAAGNALPAPDSDTQADAAQVESLPAIDAAQLQALHDAAYQQGLSDGRTQAREALRAELEAELQARQDAELQAERQRERELLRHLGIELRGLQQDPQRFYEPLKRLALHVAEQLVRGELQVSGRTVERLVQQCLQQIEHPQPLVEVQLHPSDLARLQALGEAATEHLQLQADPDLRPGSVRVRVHDTVVQDFIEHRLEPLARRLLAEPDAWLPRSGLLHKVQAEALPEDTPRRQWSRSSAEVQDTTVLPRSDADEGRVIDAIDTPAADTPATDLAGEPQDGLNDGPRSPGTSETPDHGL